MIHSIHKGVGYMRFLLGLNSLPVALKKWYF